MPLAVAVSASMYVTSGSCSTSVRYFASAWRSRSRAVTPRRSRIRSSRSSVTSRITRDTCHYRLVGRFGLAVVTRWGREAVRALSERRSRQELLIGQSGQPFRHDHPPGVEDELAELGRIDRVEADLQPLEAHVGLLRAHELVGVRPECSLALLLRKGEPQLCLVLGE